MFFRRKLQEAREQTAKAQAILDDVKARQDAIASAVPVKPHKVATSVEFTKDGHFVIEGRVFPYCIAEHPQVEVLSADGFSRVDIAIFTDKAVAGSDDVDFIPFTENAWERV